MKSKKRSNAALRSASTRALSVRRGPSIGEPLERRVLLTATPTVGVPTPANGATGVALNVDIQLTVNLPNGGVNPTTVNSSNFYLYQTGFPGNNSKFVSAIVKTTGGGDALLLSPQQYLLPNTSYTLVVTSGVQDVNGDGFAPFTETFKTGSTYPQPSQSYAFSSTPLPTAQGAAFTDVQIGPDGLLYASTEDGRIFRYPINGDGTLGKPQIITSLKTANGGNQLITGFAFDPSFIANPTKPMLWVSDTYYALSGATNAPNFTSKLTVMSGNNLQTVTDAIIDLPRSVADHVNDQPVFQPGTHNLFFCQSGQSAYGAPDTTWGNRAETMLSSAILEVNTSALNLSGAPLNVLTSDVGGTYNPNAANAPVTIYATGIRNSFPLLFDDQGQLWAPANGSSSGGNSPAGPGVPALTDIQQVETDILIKVQKGAYYGHPDPARGQYVLDQGNPTSGGIPGLAFTAYPAGTSPDPNYQLPNYIFGYHSSPDGIIEYQGSAFGGALAGKFLVAEYSSPDDIVVLSRDSNDNIIGGLDSSASSPLPDRSVTGLTHLASPLSLVEDQTTGYIYVSELGADRLTLLKPEAIAPAISVNKTVVAFNTIAAGNSGASASRTETVTITNSGSNALTLGSGSISIVNNPATTAAASNFTITNTGSIPSQLAAGQTFTVDITYTATAIGLQQAILDIKSNDPNNPLMTVDLNGIGTPGLYGTNEPSLVQVLRAFDIPTIVGAGPNDVNINTEMYPVTPDASSEEVPMERLVQASSGPVTITPLASFSASATDVSRIGYYTPGDPTTSTELFTIAKSDAQTVSPTAQGAMSFFPKSSVFSLYANFPGVTTSTSAPDVHYSEDVFNTLDPTNPHKFRFFPLMNKDGTTVPNSYVFAVEDYDDPTKYNSFVNFVGIISNVSPAPDAVNAPVIGVQNLSGVPNDSTLVFSTIQQPNTTHADIVTNTGTIKINNSGDQPLIINSLTLSDTTNWELVSPPPAGTSIAPGASLNVTVQFIAQSDPSHTSNETNNSATTNGLTVQQAGGVWNGTLLISTNDPVNPSTVINLNGYWQAQSEQQNEPGLQTLINQMFGYGTIISSNAISASFAQDYPNNGKTVVSYGEEVLSGLWQQADATEPVSVVQLASYHDQFSTTTDQPTTASIGWYPQTSGSPVVKNLVNAENGMYEGQTVLPTTNSAGTMVAADSFTPAGVFGWDVGGEYSEDARNTADISLGRSGHAVRFWPLRDSSNNIVPNAWIMGLDFQSGAMINNDYQDLLYLVTNMMPSSRPATPTDLSASQDNNGTNVEWAPVAGAKGYDIFREMPDGSYGQVNTSLVTSSYYQDLASPEGFVVHYEVTAVNSSNAQSIPATTTLNLGGASGAAVPPPAPILSAPDASSGSQVVLTWSSSSGATSYIIQREDPGSNTFNTVAQSITALTYTDNTVTQGDTYQYRIEATGPSGNSAYSDTQSVAVPVITNPPSVPTNLAANSPSSSEIDVSWTASTTASSYTVQRANPGSNSFTTIASGLTTTSYTDTNVTAGSSYQYQVSATNTAGSSAYTSPVSATVGLNLPPTPTGLAANPSGNGIALTWNAATGASSYTVLRANPGTNTFSVIATTVSTPSYTDSNVVAGASYQYEVESVNASGTSAASQPITGMLPALPASLTVTIGHGANKLVKFVDSNGTLVTLKLTGPGTAAVLFNANTLSQSVTAAGVTVTGTNINISQITTSGTTAGSSLVVTTTGGARTTTLGAITVNGSLNTLMAPTAALIGTVTISGNVNRFIVGSAEADDINVSGSLLNLQVATATGITVTSAGAIRTITANSWTSNHTITAPAINSITIKDNAQLAITSGAVHSVRVAGSLSNSTISLSAANAIDLAMLTAGSIASSAISTVGSIGTVNAGSISASTIFAGVAKLSNGQALPTSASQFNSSASIANVHLKRVNGATSFAGSDIAASSLGHLVLGSIGYSNGGTTFGVAALAIKSFSGVNPSNGKVYNFNNLTTQAQVSADFSSVAITLQDIAVNIL